MKAESYTPRGAKTKLSDNPDFVPHRSTAPMSYSLRPEQIAYVKENGGSKFVRALIDESMEANND
ncbi:MAG: hypothetical protein ACRC7J_03210 [Vibrio ordalii]|uniref:hypothetical protein n=1 Tax=Vibrio ordalii TaxID=28174 RepID=UPI003F3E1E32